MNYKKVYGPYVHTTGTLKGRAYVNIVRHDGTKTTKLYSRYLMEQELGRKLDPDETVDHIDEDPANDDLSNLQILSREENARKSASVGVSYTEFVCPECNSLSKRESRYVDHNLKQGKAGPFCGRSCAGRWSARQKNTAP